MSSEEHEDIVFLFKKYEGKPILKTKPSSKSFSVGFNTSVHVLEKDSSLSEIELSSEDVSKKKLLPRSQLKKIHQINNIDINTLPTPLPPQLFSELLRSDKSSINNNENTFNFSKVQSNEIDSIGGNIIKKGILIKCGYERDVKLYHNRLFYTNKAKTEGYSISLTKDVSVVHKLPITIEILLPDKKVLIFKASTAFDTIGWTNAITLQINNSSNRLSEWIRDYKSSSSQKLDNSINDNEIISKKKRKKKKKKEEIIIEIETIENIKKSPKEQISKTIETITSIDSISSEIIKPEKLLTKPKRKLRNSNESSPRRIRKKTSSAQYNKKKKERRSSHEAQLRRKATRSHSEEHSLRPLLETNPSTKKHRKRISLITTTDSEEDLINSISPPSIVVIEKKKKRKKHSFSKDDSTIPRLENSSKKERRKTDTSQKKKKTKQFNHEKISKKSLTFEAITSPRKRKLRNSEPYDLKQILNGDKDIINNTSNISIPKKPKKQKNTNSLH